MGIMKYAIMGGVAGGATAAVRQRRVGETADILLWGKEPHISCANYVLPHCMGSVIVEHEKLLAQNEMFAIHPKNQTITIRNAGGEEYEENYGKLLLSPEANPGEPPLEGIRSGGIFTLRNVEDTVSIKAYITEHLVKCAVVAGAGFIGREVAENLRHAGMAVSVAEKGIRREEPRGTVTIGCVATCMERADKTNMNLYRKN